MHTDHTNHAYNDMYKDTYRSQKDMICTYMYIIHTSRSYVYKDHAHRSYMSYIQYIHTYIHTVTFLWRLSKKSKSSRKVRTYVHLSTCIHIPSVEFGSICVYLFACLFACVCVWYTQNQMYFLRVWPSFGLIVRHTTHDICSATIKPACIRCSPACMTKF